MVIIAKKNDRYVYPPIGMYIGTPKPAKSFEQHEIQNNFSSGIRLRPKGARQSQAEARILSNMKMIANGFGPVNGDVLNRG
jgi:hypothetical protein